ncbi:MAG: type II toxin-antitoxin system PemK/MazF family toxin [Sporichthyaceae bacterium]
MTIARGEIWTVGLDPTVANEQGGVRPCVVVSAARFSRLPIAQAIVVPLTSRDRGLAHHISVLDDGGLTRPSWAMCEAVRAVSVQRFGTLIGRAEPTTIRALSEQIALWFSEDDLTP